jgi:hypothetical protein
MAGKQKKVAPSLPREADRNKILIAVRHGLLMESGYKCGNPACRNVITLELHHIEYVSEGGGDDPTNLLVLCPYCHAMHHAGEIPVEAIRFWKGLLLALNQAFDRDGMDLLIFLHKYESCLRPSHDGVLRFARLMAAGLVELGSSASFNNGTSYAEVRLSDKGRQLVEAWMAGDEKRYRALISSP